MDKQTCYQFLNDLEEIVKAYHGRNGTYCFHYHGMQIEPWDVGLPKAIYDKIDIGDYVIRVMWMDNSWSYDDYYITFDELFEWHNRNKGDIK